jgi:hypothetical protein
MSSRYTPSDCGFGHLHYFNRGLLLSIYHSLSVYSLLLSPTTLSSKNSKTITESSRRIELGPTKRCVLVD